MPHLVLPPPPAIVQSSTTEDANSTKTLVTPTAKLVAKPISALAPPTTFAPEPSSSSVAESADLLGSVSVGTPTQQFEASNSSSDSVKFTQPLEEVSSFLTSPSPPLPTSPPPQAASAVIIKLTDTSRLKSQLLAKKLPVGNVSGQQRIVELTSKRQVYDQQRQIVTAEGNVVLRTEGTVINADRLQVNLANLIAEAQGKILLTTGKQVLRGERLTYNFIQNDGQIFSARGEIYTPSAGSDFSGSPTDTALNGLPPETPSDRILANQPLQGVSSSGGIGVTVGAGRSAGNLPLTKQGGQIRRLRFEAERVDFYPQGWQASNVRITNDPFSPPELEVRADKVTLTHESPFQDRIRTSRQRLVFDQGIALPIPKNEAVIDRRQREVSPAIAQVGIDSNDRGGVFIERGFTPIDTPEFSFRVAPQFLLQRAIKNGAFDPSSYGLRANLDGNLGLRTRLQGVVNFTSFDLNNLDNTLRASLRLRQIIGNQLPHTLNLEYSYRDRLFNGSLGFQTVQSSLGGVITSSNTPLGKTGINLNYQGGIQYVDADTDRLNLLAPVRPNNRISLGRAQASATLSRGFLLWQGKPLPPTATEGLKYTATPVVPYLQAYAVVQGVTGYYTSGDTQESLTGTLGLVGQVGHSSRPFLDYTSFNLAYSQGLRVGQSPFLFDRFADSQVLSAGFLQQLYGPVRLGVQTTFNVGTGKDISTDFILEYSRRTYGVILRYNPILGLGSLSLRISDFNWVGGSNPFTDSGIRPVVNGVPQENNYFP